MEESGCKILNRVQDDVVQDDVVRDDGKRQLTFANCLFAELCNY